MLAQEKSREQQKMDLWKNRVALFKNGQALMKQKKYTEAALIYEKYLKVLEIVFDVQKGDVLRPQMFNKSGRTKELTVVASIYWDLLRIYDLSSKYNVKQISAAHQLASFAPYTPIFADIMRRAQHFIHRANNPGAVKQFIEQSSLEKPRCFVATAAFGDPRAIEVQILRVWRDQYLNSHQLGKWFVSSYYRISPYMVMLLEKFPSMKLPVKFCLRMMIWIINVLRVG